MSHNEALPSQLSVQTVRVVDLAREQNADLDANMLKSKLQGVTSNKMNCDSNFAELYFQPKAACI